MARLLLCAIISGFYDRISIAVLFTDKDLIRGMGIAFSPPLLGLLMTSGGYVSDCIGRRAMVCFIGLFGARALVYAASLIADPYTVAAAIALSAGFWGPRYRRCSCWPRQIIPPSVTASGVGVYDDDGQLKQ